MIHHKEKHPSKRISFEKTIALFIYLLLLIKESLCLHWLLYAEYSLHILVNEESLIGLESSLSKLITIASEVKS